MDVLNDLVGYKDLKIYQEPSMFSFSLDSVLLPNFVTLNSKIKKIMDIGCGNAPIPLILSTKTPAKIIGVEIQKDVFELALKTVKYNNLDSQIKVINEDINNLYKSFESESFDVITCNPPFFKVHDLSKLNTSEYKSIARHELKLNLEQLLNISAYLLKNNGNIAIVHRPERLVDIISAMKINGIEPKKIQFVYPKFGTSSNCLLIEGTKGGKSGIKIIKPLYVHDELGNYTEDVLKFFKEE